MGSRDNGCCYCIAIAIVMITILQCRGTRHVEEEKNVGGYCNSNSKFRASRPAEMVIYLKISEM